MTVRGGAGGTTLSTTLIASTRQTALVSSTLAGDSSLLADPVIFSPATAVLAGSADIIAVLIPPPSSAVLTADSSLIADAQRVAASITGTAVLAGESSLSADTLHFYAITTVLAGSASLIANAQRFSTISAILAGSAALVANARRFSPVTAVLSGTADVRSNATVTKQASAVLAASAALIALMTEPTPPPRATLDAVSALIADTVHTTPGRIEISATLGASSAVAANMLLVTTACIDAFQYDAFQNNAFEVCGEIVRPASASGHSRFYGPFADLDDRPAPDRTLRKHKQVKVAKRPPEYFIPPEIVPLPPPEIVQRTPFVVRQKPIGTYYSPIEDRALELGNDIVGAFEATDEEDAIAALRALALAESEPPQPKPLAPPLSQPVVPLPPLKPVPVTDYDRRIPVPMRENGRLSGMNIGKQRLVFNRDPRSGLVIGATMIQDDSTDDNAQQNALVDAE